MASRNCPGIDASAPTIVFEPRNLIAAHASFRDGLDGAGQELVRKFGLEAYVAVATVAHRHRAAGRTLVRAGSELTFITLAQNIGVRCRLGRVRMEFLPDVVPGSGHSGLFVSDNRTDASALIYFALNDVLASGAEAAELHGQHELVGSLFGYPACCVAAFIQKQALGSDHTSGAIPPSAGLYDRATNPVVPYVYGAASTAFHFPCRIDCSATLALRKRRLAWLSTLNRQMSIYRELGAGVAVYGPDLGIGLLTKYKSLGKDVFKVTQVETRSATTQALFGSGQPVVLEMQGTQGVRVNDRLYAHTSQLVARFQ